MANRLEVAFVARTEQFNRAINDARSSVDRLVGDIASSSQQATVALGALAVGGGKITKSFIDAASDVQNYRAALQALTGSAAAADAELEKISKKASQSPFDLQQVAEATVVLKSLGADVDKFLPVAEGLAAVFNRDLKDAAAGIGKALGGAQAGVEILSDSFGLSRKTLIEYGAAMGEAGSVSLKTTGDIKKFEQALVSAFTAKGFDKAAGERFKTISGQASQVTDAIFKLKSALGEALAPAFGAVAAGLKSIVDGFNALSPTTKGLIAGSIALGTAMAAVGAGIAAVVAVVTTAVPVLVSLFAGFQALQGALVAAATSAGLFGTAAQTAAAAAVGLGGGATTAATGVTALSAAARGLLIFTGVGAVIAAVAGIAIAFTASIEAATAEMEKQIAKGEELRQAFYDIKPAILEAKAAFDEFGNNEKSVQKVLDKLLELNKTPEEIKKGIIASSEAIKKTQEKIEKLRSKQDKFDPDTDQGQKRRAGIQKEIDLLVQKATAQQNEQNILKKALSLFNQEAQARKDADDKMAAATDQATVAYQKLQDVVAAGIITDPKQELAALEAIIVGVDKTSEVYKKAAKDRLKLGVEIKNKEKAEALAAINDEVALAEAAGRNVAEARVAAAKKSLEVANLTKEERKSFELELAQAVGDAERRKLEVTRAANDARAKAEQRRASVAIASADRELEALQRQAEQGKDVAKAIDLQIKKRQEAAAEAARLAAEEEKRGINRAARDETREDPGRAAEIERTRAAQIKAVELDLQESLKAIKDKGAAERQAAADAEARRQVERQKAAGEAELKELENQLEEQERAYEKARKKLERKGKTGIDVSFEADTLAIENSAKVLDIQDKIAERKAEQVRLAGEAAAIGKGEADAANARRSAEADATKIVNDQKASEEDRLNTLVEQTSEYKKQNQELKNAQKETDTLKQKTLDLLNAMKGGAEAGPIQPGQGPIQDTEGFSPADVRRAEDIVKRREKEAARQQALEEFKRQREEERIRREQEKKIEKQNAERKTAPDKPEDKPEKDRKKPARERAEEEKSPAPEPEKQRPDFRGNQELPPPPGLNRPDGTPVPASDPALLEAVYAQTAAVQNGFMNMTRALSTKMAPTTGASDEDMINLSPPKRDGS